PGPVLRLATKSLAFPGIWKAGAVERSLPSRCLPMDRVGNPLALTYVRRRFFAALPDASLEHFCASRKGELPERSAYLDCRAVVRRRVRDRASGRKCLRHSE